MLGKKCLGWFKNRKLATEDPYARFHEVEGHYEGEVDRSRLLGSR